MKQDEFDLRLTQEMADLPPDPGEVQDYNPWQAAMSRILWGMALTTFRLEFFYLQYLLPLLGAALMYLGYRSLRRENPWFRLCWGLSGLLLAIHIALDILAATPVMGWIAGNPAVNWGLTWPIRGMDLLLLFALWPLQAHSSKCSHAAVPLSATPWKGTSQSTLLTHRFD